jgi:5-methylthioribose kinase
MTAQSHLPSAYPGTFFLTEYDVAALTAYLEGHGWIKHDESIRQTEKAGDGNMNCVLRIRTNQRSFILKQSRPWVEKYPGIAAPWDRSLMEARFYKTVNTDSRVAAHLPKLLAVDPDERLLMLEDLGDARDFTLLYSGVRRAYDSDVRTLIQFLISLHTAFSDPVLSGLFENRAMRSLNHEHVFSIPLRSDNGLALDTITPGLSFFARQIQRNDAFRRKVAAAGERYLDSARGDSLIHGDYFPGSWLKAGERVFVIDPEFCFYGPPEWDVGVMLAHLHLAGQPRDFISGIADVYAAAAPLDRDLTARFTGIEIMRRLIGVAQLPLGYGLDRKKELLELSQVLVLENGG